MLPRHSGERECRFSLRWRSLFVRHPGERECRFSLEHALRDAAKGRRLLRANGAWFEFVELLSVRAEEAPASGAVSKHASAFIDTLESRDPGLERQHSGFPLALDPGFRRGDGIPLEFIDTLLRERFGEGMKYPLRSVPACLCDPCGERSAAGSSPEGVITSPHPDLLPGGEGTLRNWGCLGCGHRPP